MIEKIDSEGKKAQQRRELFRTIFLEKHLHMSVKIATVTITCMAIFGGFGYLLDTIFDTKPVLLIAGLGIGFPVTQIVLIKILKNFVKNQKNSCQHPSK